MEYDKIKELINDMGNSKLTSINIEFPDGSKIIMKKESDIIKDKSCNTNDNITNTNNKPKESTLKNSVCNYGYENIVKSPMVGTFYTKSSPTEKPFVDIGARVNHGDTLCIIESMKLMNEIESEFKGIVTKILVKDGDIVEYGTPLFQIEEEEC